MADTSCSVFRLFSIFFSLIFCALNASLLCLYERWSTTPFIYLYLPFVIYLCLFVVQPGVLDTTRRDDARR